VTVEYKITLLGQTLSATVDPLRIWAETYIEQVLTAQQRYDSGSVA
jgi:DNA-binding HxlR family transcriptional regulator